MVNLAKFYNLRKYEKYCEIDKRKRLKSLNTMHFVNN